jgi:hypothetical protein
MKVTVLLWLAIASSSFVSASEVRTYRIVENGDRTFFYGGGLLDFRLSARLVGSFDVTVQDDGSAQFGRFDVLLSDVINDGSHDVGWRNGDLLSDRLNQRPEELMGALTGTPGSEALIFSKAEASSSNVELTTKASIEHVNERLATFSFFSGYLTTDRPLGLYRPALDAPSMRISQGQLQVQLVPEPSTSSLVMLGFLLGAIGTRREIDC